MPDYVAKQRLYHTADRARLVEEGDPEAAFLAVAAGEVLSEAEAKARGLVDAAGLEQYQAPDPLKAEEAALTAAEDAGRTVEAESRRNAVARLKADAPGPDADMAVYGGLAGAADAAPAAPTPAEAQPDSGNPHETLRAGAAPKPAAPAPEDVPAGEGPKTDAKADAPKADAPKAAPKRAGGK
jgi:hypothetical protein